MGDRRYEHRHVEQRFEDANLPQEEARSKSRSRSREPLSQAPLSSRLVDNHRFQGNEQSRYSNNVSSNSVSPISANQLGDSGLTQARRIPGLIDESEKADLKLKLQRNSEILGEFQKRTSNSRGRGVSAVSDCGARSASKVEQYKRSASPIATTS